MPSSRVPNVTRSWFYSLATAAFSISLAVNAIVTTLLAIKTFDAVGGKMEFQPDGTVTLPMQINELIKGGTKVLQ